MNKINRAILLLLVSLSSMIVNAQTESGMALDMRSSGKIYVVLGVLLLIFSGLITYLIFIDRKVSKIEKEIKKQ